MHKIFLFLGSINAFMAVGLGAFGAHALKAKLSPDMLDIYQTAVKYHALHALGLILIGLILHSIAGSLLNIWAGWLISAGIIIFSGSLYLLSISGVRAWGAVTPLGGLCFLAGWLLLAIGSLKGI